MELILLYLIIINAAGFLLMLVDKYQARKKLWRIPESTLMTIAAIGGSLGCLAGMYTFRHKTRHTNIVVGIPVILAIQVAIIVYLAV